MVCAVLDIAAVDKGLSVVDGFKEVLKQYDMWIAVSKTVGTFVQELHHTNSYQSFIHYVESMFRLLEKGDIQNGLLESLSKMKNKKEIVRMFCLVTDTSKTNLLKQWSTVENYFNLKMKKLTDSLSVMNAVQSNIPHKRMPADIKDIKERLSHLQKDLQNGRLTMKELENNTLWKDLLDLPDICSLLCDCVKSKVFWTSCKEIVESKFGEENEPYESSIRRLFQEDVHEVEECSETLWLLKILTEEGIGAFRNAWISLLKEHDKHVSFALRLLHGVKLEEEIESAEKILHEHIPIRLKKTLQRLMEIEKYEDTVKAVKKSLSVLLIDLDESDALFSAINSFETILISKEKECPFSEVMKSLERVDAMSQMMSSETLAILNELSQSSSLVDFLREIVDEDIRNLIDAVDCISEQQVQASTVSALIEVKSFLHGILVKASQGINALDFIKNLNKQTDMLSENARKQLPSKIHDCRSSLHNLKSLYGNVANRGAMTIEIINNITTKGKFSFWLIENSCSFQATYKHGTEKEEHSKTSLMDLRSRALLLMNTSAKPHATKISGDVLERFINYVDLSIEIAELISQLHQSGNIKFMTYSDAAIDCQSLRKKRKDLLKMKQEWNEILRTVREKYYLLNFIQGPEIHVLYNFFENGVGKDSVITIMRFIHPDINIDKILTDCCHNKSTESKSAWTLEKVMNYIGYILHFGFKEKKTVQRKFHIEKHTKKMTQVVQNKKLFVAALEENSNQVVKAVLSLFLNTTHVLPEPHQVLFCTKETTWNELELLLFRCLGSLSFTNIPQLFCIVNIESLINELQFKLVEALKSISADQDYLLALICRGTSSHPFLDELSSYAGNMSLNLSDEEVRQVFQRECPDVVTITSAVPGLGKTSSIKDRAFTANKSLYTLHISGPLHKRSIIDKMKIVNVQNRHALHLDIGIVDNPVELDTFLFELLILGHVTAGSSAFSCKTGHVFIEVGNSINDSLRKSLDTAMFFKREHLIWKNYDDFIVSKEINSPIQVVCHYLYSIETGVVDKKDLVFTGSKSVSCLPADLCRTLLRKHFGTDNELSFSVVNIFLQVLADQLKRMSCSTFLRVSQVADMMGPSYLSTIRSTLVLALIEASKEFSSRSIAACRSTQMETTGINVEDEDKATKKTTKKKFVDLATSRVEGMIRWEDSNHLIFVFHNQNIQTLSPLYRDLHMVPSHIRALFEGQLKREMQDFMQMDQTQLQNLLQKVARTNKLSLTKERLKELRADYALTPDNLLKMVLIMLRVKSQIPVVIMGETGCGKTSLMRYLAAFSDVDFEVFSIHAGIEEEDIIKVIERNNKEALSRPDRERWLFLDEVNTSEHIGLMSAAICSRSFLNKILTPNLVIMGACNPYKLRTECEVSTAGLTEKVKTDDLSKLVYRVLPLPERMVDYVWDFGSLSPTDEALYIERMIDNIFPSRNDFQKLLRELLSQSQTFVRDTEDVSYSVSLRDIQRCKTLIKWFLKILKLLGTSALIEVKSIVLALSICYHSRFASNKQRQSYRFELEKVFFSNSYVWLTQGEIQNMITQQQKDILDRMELPAGTAKNIALQENIFIILVCLLNRIPIFLVGKPGCSKSLSMQIIRSNLRGKDSKDAFFQRLPQLYCVSFQGSESSTSDGIIKVFEKAEQYQKSNEKEDVLSVVILDEIGLAEVSRFNPLKVLHSLLEPDGQPQPNVAVVGISNWALDASKMNRAIHLSRPDMDSQELYQTGISISESFLDTREQTLKWFNTGFKIDTLTEIEGILSDIAESYLRYIDKLRFKNFHGLRDFYSLVKFVSKELIKEYDMHSSISEMAKRNILLEGLKRNFGGRPSEELQLLRSFNLEVTNDEMKSSDVLKLIKDNIEDEMSRHLMCITSGESVLSLIESLLKDINREEKVVIFGSHFEEDQTADYDYRILSRIILCMEQGLVLILKDLDNIYGSLYDMLNQNYTIVGKKKHCRIALGHYSNPLCQVHDDFRCIVLVNEGNVDFSDPPFLNRFEKQSLDLPAVMTSDERSLIERVTSYVERFCKIKSCGLSIQYCFPLYSKELIPSLVYSIREQCQGYGMSSEQMFDECKKKLLLTVQPDAILRLGHNAYEDICMKAEQIKREFFMLPVHSGIQHFIEMQLTADCDQEISFMTIVLTNSSIYSNLVYPGEKCDVQVEKLGAFKSEKQLTLQLQHFWIDSPASFLFLHCCTIEDEKYIPLAKTIVENTRSSAFRETPNLRKHVYMILHIDRRRAEMTSVLPVNFLSGWELVLLDTLEKPKIPLPQLCKMSLYEAVLKKRPLTDYIIEQLFWSFTTIGYQRNGRDIESIHTVIEKMKMSTELIQSLEELICECVVSDFDILNELNWQQRLALDGYALNTSSAYVTTLEDAVYNAINEPLSKIVYQMENMNALSTYFSAQESSQKINTWMAIIHDKSLFSVAEIPPASGPECYVCTAADVELCMPLSKIVFDKIEETKDDFMETFLFVKGKCDLADGDEIPEQVMEELFAHHENVVKKCLPDLKKFMYDGFQDDYFQDFANMISLTFASSLKEELRTKIVKWTLSHKFHLYSGSTEELLVKLHASVWIYSSILSAELQLFNTCAEVFNAEENFEELVALLPSQIQCGKHLKSWFTFEEVPIEKQESRASSPENFSHAEPLYVDKLQHDDVPIEQIGLKTETTEMNLTGQDADSETFKVSGNKSFGNSKIQDSDSIEHMLEDEEMGLDNGYKTSLDDSVDTEHPVEDSRIKLVEFVCLKMMPTESCLSLFKSVADWNSKVSIILSHALLVSSEPQALHCLRFFQDLVNTLYLHLGDSKLKVVCKLADQLKENVDQTLDSKETFECVCELLSSDPYPTDDERQYLMSAYLNRCLACDAETEGMFNFLHMIKERSLEIDSFVPLKPPIHLSMNLEAEGIEDESTTIYNLLLHDESSSFEDHPFLATLDETLASFQGTKDMDSQLAVLVVDIMEDYFETVLKERIESDFDKSQSDMLSAHNLILECDYGLKFLVAVAYFKVFVKCFSKILIEKDFNVLQCEYFLEGIQAVMSSTEKGGIHTSLRNFVIKSFGKGLLPWKLYQICERIREKIGYFQYQEWTEDYQSISIEGNPLFQHVPIGSAKVSEALMEKDPEYLETAVIQTLLSPLDSFGILAVQSVALSHFYIPRSYKRQDDTFNQIAERMVQITADKHIDEANLNLLACLLGVNAFPCQELNLNEESSARESCIAYFCCSMFAVIIASNQRSKGESLSFLANCLLCPQLLSPDVLFTVRNLPFHQVPVFARKDYVKLCSCGYRFVQKSGVEKLHCPVCLEEISESPEQMESNHSEQTDEQMPGHLFAPETAKLITLFVDACFFGSLALQSCSHQELESILDVSEVDVSCYLFKILSESYMDLETMMGMNYRDLFVFLQACLLKLKGFIAMDKTPVVATKQSVTWCIQFESELNSLLCDRYQTVSEMVLTQLDHTCIGESAPELCVNENDRASLMDTKTRLELKPAIFRIGGQPSLASLRFELNVLRQSDSTEYYPFLTLVLNMLPELSVIENLLPVLQWHLATVTHIAYRFKKQECLEMTVQDFIFHDVSEKVRGILKTRFDNLQRSFSQLLDAEYKLGTPIERLHDQMKMKDCLLLSSQTTFYKVIEELVKIQNRFLDETLAICVNSNCPSLKCLARGECSSVIHSKSVPEASASSLVSFQWDEELLKFSQAELTYGTGQHIHYEFAAIEKSLALDLVIGKNYLQLDNSLPVLVFMDDFHHGFSSLVRDVMDIIPQKELSTAVVNGIQAKRNKHPRLTNELMVHVGILLALVKKTKGDPDEPVIHYVDKWKNYLTHPLSTELLPAPEDSIKLCHLVALYGNLEELNADSLVDSLGDVYRVPLHRDLEAQLLELLRSKKKEAETILKATKRLTYRCISSREVDGSRPLSDYLEDVSFWPLKQGSIEALLQLIPCGLKVQHVYQMISLMEQKLKV